MSEGGKRIYPGVAFGENRLRHCLTRLHQKYDTRRWEHVVDPESVGTFIARILADPRTINRKVMASETTMSFKEMFDTAETLAGEKTKRKYVCRMLCL